MTGGNGNGSGTTTGFVLSSPRTIGKREKKKSLVAPPPDRYDITSDVWMALLTAEPPGAAVVTACWRPRAWPASWTMVLATKLRLTGEPATGGVTKARARSSWRLNELCRSVTS